MKILLTGVSISLSVTVPHSSSFWAIPPLDPYQRRPEQLAHDVSADLPERAPQAAEKPGILVGVEQVRIAIAASDDDQMP